MDTLENMRRALNYIEENLDGEIEYSKIAQIALCSQYHFQRMFVFLIGIPLSEYIRRRRLTLAALDLQNTDDKVIDIAVKYGYSSADAFSRAFQTMQEISSLANVEPAGLVGVYSEMYNDNTTDYYIGAITTNDCPDDLVELNIPAQTWAVFEIVGTLPTAMGDVWGRIFSEFFPTTGYEHTKGPEVEWYSGGDMGSPTYRSEIWIPITKHKGSGFG